MNERDPDGQNIQKCLVCQKWYPSGFISSEGICGLCGKKRARKLALARKRSYQ